LNSNTPLLSDAFAFRILAAMFMQDPAFDSIQRAFVLPPASQRCHVASVLNEAGIDVLPVVVFLTGDERADVVVVDSTMVPLVLYVWKAYLGLLLYCC